MPRLRVAQSHCSGFSAPHVANPEGLRCVRVPLAASPIEAASDLHEDVLRRPSWGRGLREAGLRGSFEPRETGLQGSLKVASTPSQLCLEGVGVAQQGSRQLVWPGHWDHGGRLHSPWTACAKQPESLGIVGGQVAGALRQGGAALPKQPRAGAVGSSPGTRTSPTGGAACRRSGGVCRPCPGTAAASHRRTSGPSAA